MRSFHDACRRSKPRKRRELNERRFSTRTSPFASPPPQQQSLDPRVFRPVPEPLRRTDQGEGTAAGATPSFSAPGRQKNLFFASGSKGRSRRGSFFIDRGTCP